MRRGYSHSSSSAAITASSSRRRYALITRRGRSSPASPTAAGRTAVPSASGATPLGQAVHVLGGSSEPLVRSKSAADSTRTTLDVHPREQLVKFERLALSREHLRSEVGSGPGRRVQMLVLALERARLEPDIGLIALHRVHGGEVRPGTTPCSSASSSKSARVRAREVSSVGTAAQLSSMVKASSRLSSKRHLGTSNSSTLSASTGCYRVGRPIATTGSTSIQMLRCPAVRKNLHCASSCFPS